MCAGIVGDIGMDFICHPIDFKGRTIWIADAIATMETQNYLSTMLPRPFKDLEWHKGKKHRHRRHLSLLLLRGLVVTSQSQSSAYSGERLLKHGVLFDSTFVENRRRHRFDYDAC